MACRWRWAGRSSTILAILVMAAAAVMSSARAQSVPIHGYSRTTLPGIPGEAAKRVFPPKFYLYVEVKPGSPVSAEWAWVRGSYYDCTLKKVDTPVVVDADPAVPTG